MKTEHSIVRIFPVGEIDGDPKRRIPEGGGVLVDERHALTCAHVLLDAVEGETVWLDFSHVEGIPAFPATVKKLDDDADLALLEIQLLADRTLPEGAVSAWFMTGDEDASGKKVKVCGFPEDRYLGSEWIKGEFVGPTGEGWLQMDHALTSKLVKPGFSGSPAWVDDRQRAAGLVVQRFWKEGESSAYVVPVWKLVKVFPELKMVLEGNQFNQPSTPQFLNDQDDMTGSEGLAGEENFLNYIGGYNPKLFPVNLLISKGKSFEEKYNKRYILLGKFKIKTTKVIYFILLFSVFYLLNSEVVLEEPNLVIRKNPRDRSNVLFVKIESKKEKGLVGQRKKILNVLEAIKSIKTDIVVMDFVFSDQSELSDSLNDSIREISESGVTIIAGFEDLYRNAPKIPAWLDITYLEIGFLCFSNRGSYVNMPLFLVYDDIIEYNSLAFAAFKTLYREQISYALGRNERGENVVNLSLGFDEINGITRQKTLFSLPVFKVQFSVSSKDPDFKPFYKQKICPIFSAGDKIASLEFSPSAWVAEDVLSHQKFISTDFSKIELTAVFIFLKIPMTTM